MFHVKHSHKRKFLRIGRILQRCGRFACAASSAARDAASAFGRVEALPHLAGALSRVSGDRRRFASAKRQMVSTAAKAPPAAAARAAAAGFSTTRDHPIVACVASSPPASLVFTALIQLADSCAALDSRWKRWQTAGNPRWKTWQETWNPREIGVRNGQG